MDHVERIAALDTLDASELHILSLYALGWEYTRIANQVGFVEGTVKTYIGRIREKLGFDSNERVALALFYVEHGLPRDRKKLKEWIERAKSLYETISDARTTNDNMLKLIDLLADSEHADKSITELGALIVAGTDDRPLSKPMVQGYVSAISNVLPGDTNKIRLATIGRLRVLEVPEEDVEDASSTIPQILATLSKHEWRIISLVALGWTLKKIAKELKSNPHTISEIVRGCKAKLGLEGASNASVALFYVRHMLPIDVSTGQAPGEKLKAWCVRAEEIREQLREAHVLGGSAPRVVAFIIRPENIELEYAQVATALGLSQSTVNWVMARITSVMDNGCRAKIAVVATLAPFDKEEE